GYTSLPGLPMTAVSRGRKLDVALTWNTWPTTGCSLIAGTGMLNRRFVAPGARQAVATAGSLHAFAIVDDSTCPERGSVAAAQTDRAEPGSHAQPTTTNCPFDQYPPSTQPIGTACPARA